MVKYQKSKNIFNIIINNCNIRIRIFYNLNTNHIGFTTSHDYMKDYQKQYYKTHKEENKQWRINNKDKLKEYRNNIKNKYKEYHKQRYINNPRINFLGKSILTNLPKIKNGWVYHHVIYDHLNKDRYVMPMTRSKHTKLHNQMRRDGVEIQHINVRVNDFKGF